MSVTMSANVTNVKRSWADIVKGNASTEQIEANAPEEKPSKQSLQPAARGKYQCYCLGEVLVMLGHYGWIKSFEDIDHPDAVKTGGRIYVHKRDVKCDVKLAKGDVVSFYLYSDDQGLGAECCQVEERLASGFQADKQEIVSRVDVSPESDSTSTWNPLAAEFIPSSNLVANRFNLEAPEFEPSTLVKDGCFVSDFMPTHASPNITAINPAFLSDDESDDASSFNDADVSDNGDRESFFDESDQSSVYDAEVERDDDDFVVVLAPFIAKGSMSDGSTSVGVSSDSEMEDAATWLSPPPGLELPPGFRPPPGLSL